MRWPYGRRSLVQVSLLLATALTVRSASAQPELGAPQFLVGQFRKAIEFRGMLVLGGEMHPPDATGALEWSLMGWSSDEWHRLGHIAGGRVESLAVFGGDLIVGGWLESVDGTPVQHVARFDGTTWHAMGSEIPLGVSALGSYLDTLYAGAPSARAAAGLDVLLWRWDGDSWDGIPLPPGIVWGSVHALLEHRGVLWVAGSFLPGGTPAHEGLGLLAWDGGQWSIPGDGLRSTGENPELYRPRGIQGVHALAGLGNVLVAGGSMYDASRGIAGLAAWDGNSWSALPSRGVASDLISFGTMVIPTGSLVHTLPDGTEQRAIAGWDGQQWSPLLDERFAESPGAHGLIAGAVVGGTLALVAEPRHSGHYQSSYGDYAIAAAGRALLTFDGHTWTAPLAGGGAMGTVWDLERWQGRLLVGGEFHGLGRLPFSYVTSWDGTQWIPMGQGLTEPVACPDPYDIDTEPGVLRLQPIGDELYALGHFALEETGLGQQNIARWDGQRWRPLGSGLSRSCGRLPGERLSWVTSAVRLGDDLVVAGFFDRAGSLEVNGIASWDGAQWRAEPVGPEPADNDFHSVGWISDLGVHEGSLLACWSVVASQGSGSDGTHARAFRWTGSQWEELLPGGVDVGWIQSVHGETLLGTTEPVTRVRRIYRLVGNALTEYPFPGANLGAGAVKESPGGAYLIGAKLWHWNGTRLDVIQENWQLMPRVVEQFDGKLWVGSDYGLPGQWGLSNFELPASVPVLQLQLEAVSSDVGIELRWSMQPAPAAGEIEHLRLERRSGDGGAWTVVAGPEMLGVAAQGSYTDSPTANRPFVYRAAARLGGVEVASPEVLTMLRPPAGRSHLLGAQPNPFNPATTLQLQLAVAGRARLEIYSVDGRLVRRLDLGERSMGPHAVPWDGRDDGGRAVASGVYSVRLRAQDGDDVLRAVLLK